jgi:hypothetical protein
MCVTLELESSYIRLELSGKYCHSVNEDVDVIEPGENTWTESVANKVRRDGKKRDHTVFPCATSTVGTRESQWLADSSVSSRGRVRALGVLRLACVRAHLVGSRLCQLPTDSAALFWLFFFLPKPKDDASRRPNRRIAGKMNHGHRGSIPLSVNKYLESYEALSK